MKVICGNTEINKQKLGDFPIENAIGNNKTFTFCTRAVFNGADFHSQTGLSIIVSDGYRKNTLLDISTDIVQIGGRIRTKENPFKDVILHIFNPGRVGESRTEYEERLKARLEYAQKTISAYQSLDSSLKCCITKRINVDDPEEFVYYNIEEDKIEIDSIKVAYEQYRFEAIDDIYTNGVSIEEAYIKQGYLVEDKESLEEKILNNVYRGMGSNRFEMLYKMYSEARKNTSNMKFDLVNTDEVENDIISLAYDLLGDEVVEKMGYDENKVKKMVHLGILLLSLR